MYDHHHQHSLTHRYDTKLNVGSISGTQAVLQNLSVAVSLGDQICTTFGPRGRDKLIYEDGKITISNDGATILKLLKPEHPSAQLLVKLSASQDVEIGDGTTSVVLFASYLCEQAYELIHRGFHTHVIISGYKLACQFVLSEMEKMKQNIPEVEMEEGNAEQHSKLEDYLSVLRQIISVPLNSKILSHSKNFFVELILNAMKMIKSTGASFDMDSISIVSVPGASLQDSYLIDGVIFKRTFSYAGFEQQQKRIVNPKILLLNQEIELKHQKEFAHLMINNVSEYEQFVDTEWELVYRKMDQIYNTGCNLVLDMQGIGDLATQHFVQKAITNISRISSNIMDKIMDCVGGTVISSLENLSDIQSETIYGSCQLFEEITIGDEQYCVLSGNPNKKHITLVLRASSEEILLEAERSIHDTICALCNALKYLSFLYGGGATEMTLKTMLHNHCDDLELSLSQKLTSFNTSIQLNLSHQQSQIIECMRCAGNALEELVVTLAKNANLDSADIIAELNHIHHQKTLEHADRYGVNIETGCVDDMELVQVYEPSVVKSHAFKIATEYCCMILSIDHVVKMPPVETEEQRALRLAQKHKQEKQAIGNRAQK